MKPSIPKGTRDFSSEQIAKRRYIISVLQKSFELFGFEPLETPSFENLSTLTGKYGEEGDRLIFKILNSGDFLAKVQNLDTQNSKNITPQISEKALRYDLTVPFARFVAMNHGQLTFPFKRYQIQPVWRADNPQKGRFREFFQCDADVVGSESIWIEIDLINLYLTVFNELKIPVTIQINHRKILTGIAAVCGLDNQFQDFAVALDKLDKIGLDKVLDELRTKNISEDSIALLKPFLEISGSNEDMIEFLKTRLKDSEIGQKGIQEIEFIFNAMNHNNLQLNLNLARGLDYYTGAIFEVKAEGVQVGSIGGGGRYDNLTEMFGVKNIPGIGISFGLDRIELVMNELGLFKNIKTVQPTILFFNFSDEESMATQSILKKLRSKNIACELYPTSTKLQKQFQYAEKKGIPYVAFYGKKEIDNQTIVIKNIITGNQKEIKVTEISTELKNI